MPKELGMKPKRSDVSLEAYIWAANLPLSACGGTSFRVLLQLADRADKLGYGAYPAVPTMAETLRCSDRTVQRALRELEGHGLIRQGDQRFVQHIPPRVRPTVYDVLTDALIYMESRGDSSVTPSPEWGDTSGPSGVTPVVTQTVLNPLTKTSPPYLTLVTARESGTGR